MTKQADEIAKERLFEESKKKVNAMADRTQSVKVRVKAANLLGFLAKYDSMGSAVTFKHFFIADEQKRTRIVSLIS